MGKLTKNIDNDDEMDIEDQPQPQQPLLKKRKVIKKK
jgi:hypothetical protein